jgi:hypothetical protein
MHTLVTGLWDINRNNLNGFWKRSFEFYLDKFSKLLETDNDLIIFGDNNLKDFVFSKRTESNTQFIETNIDEFKINEYYPLIQNIRKNKNWLLQNEWIAESPQGSLEMYNPIVMSKMMLLDKASRISKFNVSNFYWIDAGIRTDNNIYCKNNLKDLSIYTNFIFISFPYHGKEIHGFNFEKIKELTNDVPDMVSRATFFGGNKNNIKLISKIYYNLMIDTLKKGFMGTEESLFTILTYNYPELIDYHKLEEDDKGDPGVFIKKFKETDNKNNLFNNKLKNYKLPISIGILSWKSNETLINTLNSYLKNGLFDIANDITLFFQECSEDDIFIANEYNIPFIACEENIGIGKAFIKLAQIARTDNILLLEHDWELKENKKTTYNMLKSGIELINIDHNCVRYRHRKDPGYPLYSMDVYKGNELNHYDPVTDLISPHLIECFHWIDDVDIIFNDKITKKGSFYTTTSRWSSFTNNPCLYKKNFYLNVVSPFKDKGKLLENDISYWWARQNFKIAFGEGLFTHNDIQKHGVKND